MPEQLIGTIDSIYTKDITIKRGPRAGQTSKVYHAIISGEDVNLGWSCPYEEGERVNIQVETSRFGGYELAKGNGKATPTVATVPAGTAAKSKAQVQAGAFPVGKNTKDVSIIRQNSMTHATQIVRDMIQAGTIVKPLCKEEYLEKVIEVAYTIADFSTGWREVKMAEAMAAYKEDEE